VAGFLQVHLPICQQFIHPVIIIIIIIIIIALALH